MGTGVRELSVCHVGDSARRECHIDGALGRRRHPAQDLRQRLLVNDARVGSDGDADVARGDAGDGEGQQRPAVGAAHRGRVADDLGQDCDRLDDGGA